MPRGRGGEGGVGGALEESVHLFIGLENNMHSNMHKGVGAKAIPFCGVGVERCERGERKGRRGRVFYVQGLLLRILGA